MNGWWKVTAVLALCAMGSQAAAQEARLEGTVTDASRATVAGASITVESSSTGWKRQAVTGQGGTYVVHAIAAGHYSVRVEMKGFKTALLETLELGVGETRTVDIRLETVTQGEELVVTEEEEQLVVRFSPELGRVIQSRQLRTLPSNGRQWTNLMMLAPGAVNLGSGNQGSIRFFGRSVDDNNWTLDGVDLSGVLSPTSDTSARLLVSLESIDEFRVSSGLYSAELGTGAGGQIQLITRRGQNRFTGSVFDYFRHDALDAPTFGAEEQRPFRMHQFGGNLAGPIRRNRTFFFLNYEGIRQRVVEDYSGSVPSAAFRARVAAQSPSLQRFLDAYPRGTVPTADPDIDRVEVAHERYYNENALMLRVDHQFSETTTGFVRVSHSFADFDSPANAGGVLERESLRPLNGLLQLQRQLSPSAVNTLRLAVNRAAEDEVTANGLDTSINVPGFLTLTRTDNDYENGTSFSLSDDVAVTLGRHSVRVGAEARHVDIDYSLGGSRSLRYSSREDFARNSASSYSMAPLRDVSARRNMYSAYVQDDIKLKFNLTVNLGLRYELYSVPSAVGGESKVWEMACGGYCAEGTRFYRPDYNNIAPRFGFNWAPAALGYRTVIRGGAGAYYGPGETDDLLAPIENTDYDLMVRRSNVPALGYPADPFVASAQTELEDPEAVDSNRRDLKAYHYGLFVQQQLPASVVLQVGYVGSQGRNLYSESYVNVLDPVTRTRPLPDFSRVSIIGSDGTSSYNGLHVSLSRAFSHGLSFGGEYIWSHSIDDGSVGGGDANEPQNVNDRASERASSSRDVRHSSTLHAIWELPFGRGKRFFTSGALGNALRGFELSGILQARTGRPHTVTISRPSADLPDGNSSNQRPNLVPGVSLIPPGGRTAERWINPEAFAVPAKGTWGNAGRNIVRGPSLVQLDLSLRRRFSLKAGRSVDFRWDVFNVFNRLNLDDPNTNLSSANFGRITEALTDTLGTGTSRQMQFSMRVSF